jgi:hypothetical protein
VSPNGVTVMKLRRSFSWMLRMTLYVSAVMGKRMTLWAMTRRSKSEVQGRSRTMSIPRAEPGFTSNFSRAC